MGLITLHRYISNRHHDAVKADLREWCIFFFLVLRPLFEILYCNGEQLLPPLCANWQVVYT